MRLLIASRLARDVAISSQQQKKNSAKIARIRQRQIHHFLNNNIMGAPSTGTTELDISERNFNFYDVIDVLAVTPNSKQKFFANTKNIELSADEFNLYLIEEGKFNIKYCEDGVVEIYVKIDTDKIPDSLRVRNEV
jgi:hypothetical protein